jgi:hypothetical protein
MTELSFAKSFLSTLDARPLKLPADHISDPKTFTPKGPYTLPRMSKPMTRAYQKPAPGAQKTVSITLKSMRNPPLEMKLQEQSLDTSILDLKNAVAREVGLEGVGKVRVLWQKKPCADSKSVKDVVGDLEVGGEGVEFSVMIIGGVGGADDSKKSEPTTEMEVDTPPVAQGPSGEEVLGTEEFWGDLRGFLVQRLRDEGKAGEVFEAFRGAWRERGAG